jgi:hypothetical protein
MRCAALWPRARGPAPHHAIHLCSAALAIFGHTAPPLESPRLCGRAHSALGDPGKQVCTRQLRHAAGPSLRGQKPCPPNEPRPAAAPQTPHFPPFDRQALQEASAPLGDAGAPPVCNAFGSPLEGLDALEGSARRKGRRPGSGRTPDPKRHRPNEPFAANEFTRATGAAPCPPGQMLSKRPAAAPAAIADGA